MWNGWGNDGVEHALSERQGRRAHRRRRAEAHAEVGVRFRRRDRGVGTADHRRRARVRRQRQRHGRTRSISRPAAPTGRSRPTAACARRSASRASPVSGAPRTMVMFGDVRANVYGARRADRRAALEDQGRRARVRAHHRCADAMPTAACTCRCRRSKKCPAHARTIRAAPSAAASSRSMRRPASRSGRPT